ncbi:MAG: glycosyltransferase family 2 protein [Acidobacteriota bacterium]
MKKIEVVIPVHNRKDYTRQCLESLAGADTNEFELHVIVVDDGSTDGTAEMLASDFPDISIIKGDGNLWYTAATNRGFEAALLKCPDYILACNDDVRFAPDAIERLFRTAEEHQRSVVGALLLNWQDEEKVMQVSPQWRVAYGGFRHWYRQTIHTVPNLPWRVEAIVGNCVLYPAAAIRKAGLMDEKNLVQYGDAEYTPRLRRRGWVLLIDPRARVFTEPNKPIKGFRQMTLTQKFQACFFSPGGQYSFRRRVYMTLGGAPNTAAGLLALGVFAVRAAFGRTFENSWAVERPEKPLKDVVAGQVVKG